MTYDLPEEMNFLRDTVRRFVDKELIPIEAQTLDGGKLKPEYREKFEARMRELGLWKMNIPVEYGGLGMGVLADTIVEEEMSRTVALPQRGPKITGPEIRPTLYNLTGEMRERYLMPCIAGKKKACFGQTEPDAGSDPGSMRTTAVREGDEYVINGVKHFINNADEADFAVLMAATDRKKGSHGGISAFIVDMDTPGVSLPTNYKIITGERLWKIQFDNVRVPASHLVMGEGQGFKLGQQALGLGRINQAARAVGVTERCLELATNYAKQRVTFGAPLSDRQSIQWMLVDPFVELHLARMALYDAAKKADEGQDVRVQAYMVKLFCCELAYRTSERCLHIHGATGLVSEMPTSALWHAARTYLIGEGTPEVMRMVLARKMFEYYT
jgi:acyl-CoA dehydrogenase